MTPSSPRLFALSAVNIPFPPSYPCAFVVKPAMPEAGLLKFAVLPHGIVIANRHNYTFRLTRMVGASGEDFIVEQSGCARYFRHRVTAATFARLQAELAPLPETSECGCR